MAELGYVPNAAARSLITQRTHILGLVVSNITNAFYPELCNVISEEAIRAGYSVILGSAAETSERQAWLLQQLAQQRVDGAILTSTFVGGESDLQPLLDRGLTVVLANRVNAVLDVDSVAVDNVGGSRLAIRHLIERGRRRIAFIGGHPNASTNRDRFRGYCAALEEAGRTIDHALVEHSEYTHAWGYRAVQALLEAGIDFDAIFAADDTIALGCLDALGDAGISAPSDVAIVGFDDIPLAAMRAISLSTVSSEAKLVGEIAIGLLLDRIEGRYVGPARRLVLPANLVVRRSSG
jgi:LacI family transcriptional regulator